MRRLHIVSSRWQYLLKNVGCGRWPHVTHIRQFSYKPLETGQIRVLDLGPGHASEPLRCQLRHVSVLQNPQYESLSYCWGQNKPEAEIICNGSTLPVTKNLLRALQQLRYERQHRSLWADAICIDQSNVEERGQQVSLMKDIFHQGKRTVVWLGDGDKDSQRTVGLIRALAQLSRERSSQGLSKSHESDRIPPLYDPVWKAFTFLLQRPWFHRTWVVSEVSVAAEVEVICGDQSLPWSELIQAIEYAVDIGVFVAYGGGTTFQALRMSETRALFQQGRAQPLYQVLLNNRSFLATDPRDKIYGVLSLANSADVESMKMQADYTLGVEELYIKMTKLMLERVQLDVFGASRVQSKDLKNTLPSWVTDWAASDPSVPLTSIDNLVPGGPPSSMAVDDPVYNAASSTASTPLYDESNNILGLDGIVVDEIEAIGVLSRTRYLRRVSHMFELHIQGYDIIEQLKNWEQIARMWSRKSYPTGESRLLAYWKTLCAGRVPKNLDSVVKDPRFKYYILTRSLRRIFHVLIRTVPRNEDDTWYNRLIYTLFQFVWRTLGLTPTKIQRIGFPPESRLSNYRRMARTKRGYFALAPRYTRPGDMIGIFKGGRMPLVMRKKGQYWTLLGESYVHGIMNGEEWNEEKCERMWFE